MKLECAAAELVEALSHVSRAASPKSSLPVIEGIYMKAGRHGLYLCCYNLDMGITKTIDARVEEEGTVVVPLRFCDMVRHMPQGTITITCDEKYVVNIRCGQTDFDIIGMTALDFPDLPVVDGEHNISIEESKLKTMISQTAHAISTRQDRPVYTGALFEIENHAMRVITLDGYRIAVREESIVSPESYDFIVPGKTLGEIGKLLRDGGEMVDICVAKHNIIFLIDGYSVISRLMTGNFINYRTAFDMSIGHELSVKTSDIVKSVERMSLVNSESQKSPVRCSFGNDRIRVRCETPLGRADDTIVCEGDFDSIEVAFNNKYMLDAFRAADTDELRIIIAGGNKAVRILPPEGEHFMFMLMPVNI